MQQAAPRSKTVFRTCVVGAVREGEALMQELVQITRGALASQENELRDLAKRDLVSDALRLLNQHEAALFKGYPMALLEIFADGPEAAKPTKADATGLDFGDLSLVDDDEVQAQVELSRAQQLAVHATEAVLNELNTLVSAAQGLRRVHPERNPLRPENYIRALQQVIAETGVAAPIREVWMQPMRNKLGTLLVDVYKRAVKALREQGVQPVGFAGAVPSRMAQLPSSGYGGAYASGGPGSPSQWGGPGGYPAGASGYGAPNAYQPSAWSGDPGMGGMAPDAEEALLTVGILRQMLAGGADPYQQVIAPAAAMPMHPSSYGAAYGAVPSMPVGGQYTQVNAAASEAMEDIAELERLVGRLAGSSPGYVPSGHSAPRSLYGVSYGAAEEASPALAAEVVARMVENIARDARLLPPVQKAVQSIEPAIRKLVRHDVRFFSDANHPARRLLDEVTQRSLAFGTDAAPGFRSFMRLVEQAIDHLAQKEDITSPAPFEAVLKALESAWEKQEKKQQVRREQEQQRLLLAEQCDMLAGQIAAKVRTLAGIQSVPPDILEFITGPWARVAALAQAQAQGDDGDPKGYLALVPELIWSMQPDRAKTSKEKLVKRIPGMLAKLREGLKTIEHTPAQTSVIIERLVLLHQQVLNALEEQQQAVAPEPVTDSAEQTPPESLLSAAVPLIDVNLEEPPSQDESTAQTSDADSAATALAHDAQAEDPFYIGAWVDLVSNGKVVRTQLTWVSPHKTLFLFTGADGSSQSMTRRMRDKLASEGMLRILPRQHVVDSAISAMASSRRRKRSAP